MKALMNSDKEISRRDRVLGGLWGALVGDALGVPVEFKSREGIRQHPVRPGLLISASKRIPRKLQSERRVHAAAKAIPRQFRASK